MGLPVKSAGSLLKQANLMHTDDQGAVGYILLWLLGVPASLLFLIFLVRGCN